MSARLPQPNRLESGGIINRDRPVIFTFDRRVYQGFEGDSLASALLATNELCGIFYAYQKMNPIPFGEMKAKSIKKKIKDLNFAAKVDRATIFTGCEHLGIDLDEHVTNLIKFLSPVV